MSSLFRKKQGYIHQIRSLRDSITRQSSQSTEDALIKFENQLILDELEACFTGSTPDVLDGNIARLLSVRWERIRHSSISYTNQPSHPINQLCLDLASDMAPLPQTEEEINDLPFGVGPYFILMPTLKAHQDIYRDNIHLLSLREFVLSDDGALFIPIDKCLQHAFESDDGKLKHVVSMSDKFLPLTPSEEGRFRDHSSKLNDYYKAILAYNAVRVYSGDFGARLNELQQALIAGGVRHQGQELDSGSLANEGIVKFSQYWDTLSTIRQEELYALYRDRDRNLDLKDALGRLFRPDGAVYQDSIFCVEVIAEKLHPIILNYNMNNKRLKSFKDQVVNTQEAFLSSIACAHDYHQAACTQMPKIFSFILRLRDIQQKEIFKYSPDQNALIYAMEHEPSVVVTYLDGLSDVDKQRIIKPKINSKPLLVVAAEYGLVDVVDKLLLLGAVIDVIDKSNGTALQVASRRGHLGVVLTLLDHGASIDAMDMGITPLRLAVQANHLSIVDALLAKGARVNIWAGNNALVDAIRLEYMAENIKVGNDAGVRTLLRLGVNIDALGKNGFSPLMFALQCGHLGMVETLLENGASISLTIGPYEHLSAPYHRCRSAFDLAVTLNNPVLLRPLLKQAIKLDFWAQSALLENVSGACAHKGILNYVLTKQRYRLPDVWDLYGKDAASLGEAKQGFKLFFDFDRQIQPLQIKFEDTKMKRLKNPEYLRVALTMQTLMDDLQLAKVSYLLDDGDVMERQAAFKNACLDAIEAARPVLETHRAVWKLVVGFMLALVTLPISLPLYAAGFFSTKTKSAQIIDRLERDIRASNTMG